MTLENYLSNKYSEGTIKAYFPAIRNFLFQTENPREVRYKDVMEYVGKLRQKYKNVETVKNKLLAIKVYFNYLVETGERKDHPCRELKLKDKSSKQIQLQDLFTEEELEQLLDREERYEALKTRNKLIISLLIYQGLTTGEIVNLELKDIELEKAEIEIKPSRRLNKRTLKLEAKQVSFLYKYLYQERESLVKTKTDKLIINKLGKAESGEQISYLLNQFKSKFKDRNLNPITIRQSVITNKLKQGNDLRIVQVFAGHKYSSSTEKYKQTEVEELANQINKFHPLQ